MSARKRNKLPDEPVQASIDSMTHEGRGVTRVDGKAVFVDGVLPGETVTFRYTRRSRRYDEGRVDQVLEASNDRVEPRCPHFGVCGGCVLQHMDPSAQVRAKEQAMLENLKHLGSVSPERVLTAITGPRWGYRRKARLGVKHVPKKGGVLVGFRERGSPYLAELEVCHVLHPAVGERIMHLRELLTAMQARERIPQIEVGVGDDDAVALVFRHLDPLTEEDQERLKAFGQDHDLQIWLQPGGPDSITPLWPESPADLCFTHPEEGLRIPFSPVDFIQVNRDVNHRMVPQAMELLQVAPEHGVLDLFCGLGNFTLPLARRAARVTGVEGDAAMVERARENAVKNGIHNTRYFAADLSADLAGAPWLSEPVDRVLLDPPRSGAREVLGSVAALAPERIVYVSCNPATLARDAGELVREHGYRLEAAGVMDMFPHTAHVESMAVFSR
ncbi:23S rRNA (uracil(1939)-C(5))-methyltransferase RlmD [Ectothiorhodospira variabilis]|uniref:23S rRNA (uracil(1939)-C(5))-methyltransferase RlmD n=1 Tax=Ectothiorhodospira variabilis TaxID=505694 RepID=UPI001EFBCE17|nr:23S rRNA (uracil(1939)-C(5))-methyltransferase RlmD [Ectothiorhodospira variabilis]MCG5493914.1 23S rRNA (uracil(1939)-C(5))-methyltransferase RlmD [Ectothiorhodospira variabilis]MCG5498128.1 23S rRNA (uracil(1939)-C(5))-methyltransferase RlmD [Ectothiorhodospira variabilis]MCG5503717.1 23S rRNA (uracil(1939)-C(5))-methyltransferase RlmD [Ectothiorhodospira variabilis]MCG5506873.1 23S rRNA (uracil(1939)-C(5))-methyltransferase RlmD [Ectothiorhodospira variabilis]